MVYAASKAPETYLGCQLFYENRQIHRLIFM